MVFFTCLGIMVMTSPIKAQISDVYINEVLASNVSGIQDDLNDHPDWIEIYNSGTSPVNLGGYTLTDDKNDISQWTIPSYSLEPESYLYIFASGRNIQKSSDSESSMHTNFKLNDGGEFIGLYDGTGQVVDSLTFTKQRPDISYGRSSAEPGQWGFFDSPTPGSENETAFTVYTEKPQFSIIGGFYTGSQSLTLSTASEQGNIYYTTDGTLPETTSAMYSGPIAIDTTMAIRAYAVEEGKEPSEIVTQTYFIDEEINMPFISLVTDPDHLFSDETGIYVTGTNGTRGSCDNVIRNVNRDWERPVNIEFYEPGGELGLNQVAGIKIFGGCSRTRFPQKSFALFARSQYGDGTFEHQIFPDKPIGEFEAFLLRSAADDQQRTFMRDPLTQEVLIEYTDLEYQAYRPAVVFINGEYWGIHNVREKFNEHYFTGNFDVDPEDVNILEGNASVVHGSGNDYLDMLDYIESNDMDDASNYEYVKTQMDVSQFIDYEISNIYLAEVDWPGNNIKFWKANTGKYTRWRWLNYDRDQCFMEHRIEENTLDLATDPNGSGWPNPSWSTLLLRELLESDDFRNHFIQLYAYHLSLTFQPDRLIEHIDTFENRLAPEIPRHTNRWGGQKDPDSQETWQLPTFESLAEWQSYVEEMRLFSKERPPYAIQHIMDKFGVTAMDSLFVEKNIANSGTIKLYGREIPDSGYHGDYFRDIPTKLKALPAYGYRFSHWEVSTAGDTKTYTEQEIDITLQEDMALIAHFEKNMNIDEPLVIINEINYHALNDYDAGDWLELYNRSDEIINMTGWYLKDSNEENFYYFEDGFELVPNGYIVICENVALFDSELPDINNRTGDLGFKLSNGGEVIRLYAPDGALVDSVLYDDDIPWPTKPDGSGLTLELIDPDLENDLPENWRASAALHGTPGKENSEPEESLTTFTISGKDQGKLHQNYPNPFDSYTTIVYTLPENGHASIRIYNMVGQQIAAPVNQYRSAGTYSTEFHAGNLAKGIYIYTLHIDGNPVETRKMIVE